MAAKGPEGPGRDERRDMKVKDRRDNPLMSLQREMNTLFENFFNGKNPLSFGRFDESLRTFTPRMDITENEKEVRISAELPGMKPEEIRIAVDNDLLTLEGEKKSEIKEKQAGYYRMERSFGVFQRAIRIPSTAAIDKGRAVFKDGVLTLLFPKRPKSRHSVTTIPVAPAD